LTSLVINGDGAIATAAHFSAIATLTKLENLELPVDTCDLEAVGSLPCISELRNLTLHLLCDNGCGKDFSWLSKFHGHLYLESNGCLSAEDVAVIAKACPDLKGLHIKDSDLTLSALRPLLQCKRLQRAYLNDKDVLTEIQAAE
jgi:hypothetical protein